MRNTFFHAVCNAKNVVLNADSEDGLERLQHSFNKLEFDFETFEQVNHFKYLHTHFFNEILE